MGPAAGVREQVVLVGNGRMKKRLNTKEACEYLGVSEDVLKKLRARRVIPYYRITAKTCAYDIESLDRFLQSRHMPALGRDGGHCQSR